MKISKFNQNSLKNDKNEIIKRVKEFKEFYLNNNIEPLFEFDKFYKDRKLTLSISGGADSMSLLLTFLKFRDKYKINFDILNFEHGIRGETSILDSFFVSCFAKEFGIDFKQINLDTKTKKKELKLSEEETARLLRKNEYKKINNIVVLAHNKEDNQDTILMNIFRGTGLKGLTGIEKINNNIVRPLLNISRKDIEKYIIKYNVPFRHDETNDQTKYSRNKVRKLIRKEIENTWPNFSEALTNLSEIAKNAIDYTQTKFLDKVIIKNNEVLIDINILKEHIFISSEVVLFALRNINAQKDITKYHIEQIISLKDKQNGKEIILPNKFKAVRENDEIRILENKDKIYFEENFDINTDKLKITKVSEFKKDSNIYIDFDKLPKESIIRKRKESDKFLKFDNKIVSLSDYLIKKKIPKTQRDKIVLIEFDNIIQAVIPYEISKNLKVDEKTKNIIKLELID